MSNILRLKGGEVLKGVLRMQSPSRTCEKCGGVIQPQPTAGNRRMSSISTALSALEKRKNRKLKGSLTEIIQVSADSVVSESTAQLSKLNPKEIQRYMTNITKSAQIIKKPFSERNSSSMILANNYATVSTSASTVNPIISSLKQMEHDSVDLKELSMEFGQDYEGEFFLNNTPTYMIPSERDLIDKDVDFEGIGINVSAQLEGRISEETEADVPIIEASNIVPQIKEKSRAMKKEEKELAAKIRMEEMERLGKELSLNRSLVAYLEMCVFTEQINRGLNTLIYYTNRSKIHGTCTKVTSIDAFNTLLNGFSNKGNILRVKELFKMVMEDKRVTANAQTYAAVFECLGRNGRSKNNSHSIRQSVQHMEAAGMNVQDLFNKTALEGDQREIIIAALRRVMPNFEPYSDSTSDVGELITASKIESMFQLQLEIERKGTLTVKSIEKKDNLENLAHYRTVAAETELKWRATIEEALARNLNTLLHQGVRLKSNRNITLYPFLQVLTPSDYTNIIIQEIRKLSEGSETYSPGVSQLYRELGARVLARYQIQYKEKKGILHKVEQLYSSYLHWYLNRDNSLNIRQKWQELLYDPASTGPHVDVAEKVWPNSVLSSVGRFLYGIIMRDIKINANVMKMNSKTEQSVPAFYSIFRMQGMHLKEEIKPHPALVKLFQAASRDELTFDATLVPMLCPPLPWASIRTGGYLLSPAKIVRLPHHAHQQKVRLENCAPQDLYPSLDSLNQLGSIGWKINHKVLDTVIQVFNNKGNDRLNVPPPPSECPTPPTLDPTLTKLERFKIHKERAALKRKKAEMYSLWCDALYRLSLANHFRNEIFWFPHNMDFRGRVYPCPPHLNHLGADVARSMLVFAQGKPLGPNGLNWLKLHLVNLTGLKKRDSIEDRLAYADLMLDNILDSADSPLNGRQWWAESEEPWQTLACCIEIAQAIRSNNPSSYISHFPVHQDGSCNGLQHYAALGRDLKGAASVNLTPSKTPQDVYTAVAKLVERQRVKDAENGVKIAQVLDGFIKRKVIKQTVMTTVYGVTRYGARLQIAKQLKDIEDFPKEHLWPASLYLVGKTFDSLQEMFTSTKLIQDWFTECAKMISQVCGQNVEWVTPLGLPVVQPYFRSSKKLYDGGDPSRLPAEHHIFDLYEEGITYVSVHDCYWTHPSTVETMNRVCREQFVSLHSQPILRDLSSFLVHKYAYKESDFFQDGSLVDESKRRLNAILQEVPPKGKFDLTEVLHSTFFFS